MRRRSGRSARENLRGLRQIGEHVAQSAKDALKQCAGAIVASAKSRCPVKTGALRDSIRATRQEGGASFKISSLYYGRFIELSPRINKPFLYPALEENREAIRQSLRGAIRQALRQGRGD